MDGATSNRLDWNGRVSAESSQTPRPAFNSAVAAQRYVTWVDEEGYRKPLRVGRRQASRAIASQSQEFRQHNLEYGYTYTAPSAAVVPGASPAPEPIDSIRTYRPSTTPGHPVPHAWLDADDGTRLSTLDLVKPGRFLLIAGELGVSWCEAATNVSARLGVAVDAVRIGHVQGDYLDPRCQWLQRREIGPDGAILIRPDRFIAWRSLEGSQTPEIEIEGALEAVLAREPLASAS